MRKSLTPLGETEMEVLHHVWNMKKASVSEVHEEIRKTRKVAYTTIMTVMKKLGEKGYLKYEKQGVTYIYSPAQEPETVKHNLLNNLLQKVFKGSPMAMMQTLVQNETISGDEIDEIKKMIGDM